MLFTVHRYHHQWESSCATPVVSIIQCDKIALKVRNNMDDLRNFSFRIDYTLMGNISNNYMTNPIIICGVHYRDLQLKTCWDLTTSFMLQQQDIEDGVNCIITMKHYFPKPGPQSRALCGTVSALSIANTTLLNWPIVSLLIFFCFILFNIYIFFVF